MNEINIGIVGAQFMGRAHSNAWMDVAAFYELSSKPVLRAACDNQEKNLPPFMKRFGWQTSENDYKKLIARDDIQVIDICTSNATHKPIAVEAAKAGKHVICEKPIALDAQQAKAMYEAAEEAGIVHLTAFNYRRVPAIALAKKLIDEGKIGVIHHFNAVYYQDWLVDPKFPMVWRHNAKVAGSGAHGDMNAHTVDLARYLVGDFEAVSGIDKIFVPERTVAGTNEIGEVTADDCLNFHAKFQSGAIGSFMATRFATGRKNYLRLEIFGSEGAIIFNLERLNELEYYSRNYEPEYQGFQNIIVTENTHPYINKWWPPGHIIGWEHTFIHEIGDFLTAIEGNKKVSPDFYDGYRCQQVLDAALLSAQKQQWISIPEN